jgi:signal transduction histidine kinase
MRQELSTESWRHEKPTLFYGFRLRHALALLICLCLILILAGYFAVSAGKKASLESVMAQGRAMTETLISSAEMIIESNNEITSLAIDNLISRVNSLKPRPPAKFQSSIELWRRTLEAERLSLLTNRKILASSIAGQSDLDNSLIQGWLDSLEIDPEAEIIYDFISAAGTRYLLSYFPIDDTLGLLTAIDWQYGQYGNERLSLYDLLNEVGQETGVEYIMLQNQDGIIFASKKVASMTKLSDDPFLVDALDSDTTRSRLVMFQDREVLESVRLFQSNEFDGIFRVGLSLYGYRQIIGGVKRQVWLVVAALIIVGMLSFGIVSGFQNYEFLRAGFHKARVISQSLLDSIPGPVVAVDSAMRITDINAMAKNRLGISQTVSADYPSVFPDDPFHFRQVIENRRSASFERALGDEKRQYFITTNPLFALDGTPIGAISIAQDITDTRKLENAMESRRRLSELGALAASMAHEIRNPLNAIGITIQRMKNEIRPSGSEDEYSKFIDGLRGEIKRLNDIIEKFLSVARAIRPEISPVDVRDIIETAVELFENQARSQKTVIVVNSSHKFSVDGDRAGLTQVLINLIKNSLEAIGKDGEIKIDVTDMGERVRISVVDNGPGIDDVSSSLKPFYTTKQGGTGLGLSTASKIMADHGGELVVESSPGNGCRIDIILPKGKNG